MTRVTFKKTLCMCNSFSFFLMGCLHSPPKDIMWKKNNDTKSWLMTMSPVCSQVKEVGASTKAPRLSQVLCTALRFIFPLHWLQGQFWLWIISILTHFYDTSSWNSLKLHSVYQIAQCFVLCLHGAVRCIFSTALQCNNKHPDVSWDIQMQKVPSNNRKK